MDNKNKANKWLIPTGLVLIFAAIILLIIFLMRGQTTIIGEFEEQKNTETVACESEQVVYSGFAFDGSDSKFLKINAIFNEQKLDSISLVYRLNYHDGDTLYFSEARNHSEMNQNFNKDGMKPDSLTAKYSVTSDSLQLSIFARKKDFNEKVLKYFMLDGIYDAEELTIEEMTKYYNGMGLDCKVKFNKTEEEVNEKE